MKNAENTPLPWHKVQEQEKAMAHSQQSQVPALGYEYPRHAQNDFGHGLDIKQILDILLRRKLTILLIILITFFTVAIQTFMQTPTYKATVKLQIENDSNNLLDYDVEARSKRNNSRFSQIDYYQTQYELLKSRTLARRTIEDLNLYSKQRQSSTIINDLTNQDTEVEEKRSMLDEARHYYKLLFYGKDKAEEKLGKRPIEQRFLNKLKVEPIKKSSLVMVHYISPDPEMAAKIVNAHTENYVALNLERRVDSGAYAENFLNEQLVLAKSRLEESESDLIQYTKQQDLVSTSNDQSLASKKLDEVYTALSEAQRERIAAQSNYEQAYANNSNKLTADFKDSKVVETLKQRRAELQIDYQEKLEMFRPAYPVMVEIKTQIDALTAQINQENEATKQQLSAKYEVDREELKATYLAAVAKQESLQKQLETQKQQLFNVRDKSIRLNTLKREVETNRNMYEGLLKRIKEVGVASSISANNISIIDPAIVPYRQHSPKVQKSLSRGLLIGIFLGVLVAFLLEFFDDRIKAAKDLENLLPLPMLGLIPTSKEKQAQKLAIITETDPKAAISESFRSLRANLLFATKEGIPKVLHVTSSRPSEGKSSTVINLGIVFAQSGKKVLIVDGDLRKPSVHQRLQLDNTEGFTNFLTHQKEAKELIQTTDIENLSILPAGPISPNPAELLSSERMDDLYRLVPDEYDLIIMDSPPVMGLSDALILANQASATVLLAAHGESRRRLLQDAYQKLLHAQANIIGTVLTKTKARGGYGYSYYNYDYYDYYSYGEETKKIKQSS